MMRRPKKGRTTGPSDTRPPQARRSPPPERTGLEPAYLGALEESQDELVICLRDGERLRGRIEGFDREVILLKRPDGGSTSVRKSKIRYLEEIEPLPPSDA